MKRILTGILALTAFINFESNSQPTHAIKKSNNMNAKKVLFVVTSFDEVKNTGKKTGIWIEEFATPYYLLKVQGIDITVASPKGGKAPIDPKSTLADFSTPLVKQFFSDSGAQQVLNNTLLLANMNASDYDAIFYPGGHGPMWDLPDNAASIRLIETFYQQQKPVALVCHAPAALQNVTANGIPLIKGKQVAGFTNSEEVAGQSTDQIPFSLEDMLQEKGANYKKGADWQPFAVQDGHLITGQNPASAALVAEKIVAALGKVK